MIKERIMEACYARDESNLEGLRGIFNSLDRDGNGSLDPVEFKRGMHAFGV